MCVCFSIFPYEAIRNPLDDSCLRGKGLRYRRESSKQIKYLTKFLAIVPGGTWSRSGPPSLLGVEAGRSHALGRLRTWPEVEWWQLPEDSVRLSAPARGGVRPHASFLFSAPKETLTQIDRPSVLCWQITRRGG